jgi:hypothetical protein
MTNDNRVNPNRDHWLREDYPLELSGFGSKRQTKSSSGTTKVDTHPDMKMDAKPADDGKGAKEVGRGFDKNTDPARNRNSIEFPGQNYSPKNPVSERNLRLTKNYLDAIEANTKRSQRLQRPGKE